MIKKKKRRHLGECIENQNFVYFPFPINTNWKKKKVLKTRESIYCSSRGLYDSAMVQCVVYESWIHHKSLDESTLRKTVNDPNHFALHNTLMTLSRLLIRNHRLCKGGFTGRGHEREPKVITCEICIV